MQEQSSRSPPGGQYSENPLELDNTTENERFSSNINNSRYQNELNQLPQRLNDSQITTQTELQRYEAFSQHVTAQGMIQATIYHIRQYGQNIFDAEEKDKYYSDDFLQNQRHINDKVEQELEEFKIEINEKVECNTTRNFVFPRPGGEEIYLNTDSNVIEVSHSQSAYHELPLYDENGVPLANEEESFKQAAEAQNRARRGGATARHANDKYIETQRQYTDQSMSSLLNNSRQLRHEESYSRSPAKRTAGAPQEHQQYS